MKFGKNLNNQELSNLLKSVAAVYEINNENLFRIRAYETAADSVEHATREVKDLWEEGKLQSLSGIGKNIASHVDELYRTGKVKHFQQVFKNVPASIFEFIGIPGIGPKTAFKLASKLKIKSKENCLKKLRAAAENGIIRKIEGFGEDSEKAILKGIEEYQRRENRLLLPLANRIAQEVIDYMKNNKYLELINPLGSLRRRSATIGDIDIGAATGNPKELIKYFCAYPKVKQVLASGENTARVILKSGIQVDIKTQHPEQYGALLQHFTGSKSHNIHLRELAQKKGFSLSEHGIKVKDKQKKFKNEESFYNFLGLKWIPPELREDAGEIELARSGKLPKLVELRDLRGDLHLHTNYSWQSSHDAGTSSIGEIIEKATDLGYEYIGIGDHNPSLSAYNENELNSVIKERYKTIEEYKYSKEKKKEKRTMIILNTLELDILKDGKLAITEKAFKYLDYAVVSIHSSMRMSKSNMTKRVMKGLSHPKAKILGHPTGRLLNAREGYELEWDRLFRMMKQEEKILEINAWSKRLDLPDTLVKQAIDNDVKIAINTDAHSIKHMDLLKYGIDVARRGWAEKSDIINTFEFKELKEILL